MYHSAGSAVAMKSSWDHFAKEYVMQQQQQLFSGNEWRRFYGSVSTHRVLKMLAPKQAAALCTVDDVSMGHTWCCLFLMGPLSLSERDTWEWSARCREKQLYWWCGIEKPFAIPLVLFSGCILGRFLLWPLLLPVSLWRSQAQSRPPSSNCIGWIDSFEIRSNTYWNITLC